MRTLTRLFAEEDGMNMVEYALIGALVSVSAIAVLRLIGPALSTLFTDVNTDLQ